MVTVKVACKPHLQQAHGGHAQKVYRIPGHVLQVGGEPVEVNVTEREAEHLKLDSFLTVEVAGPSEVRQVDLATVPQVDDGAEDSGKRAKHKK